MSLCRNPEKVKSRRWTKRGKRGGLRGGGGKKGLKRIDDWDNWRAGHGNIIHLIMKRASEKNTRSRTGSIIGN